MPTEEETDGSKCEARARIPLKIEHNYPRNPYYNARRMHQTGIAGVCFVVAMGVCARYTHYKTNNRSRCFGCRLKVIPAGWSVSAPDAHRGHFFRLTLHSLMRFSTLKFQVEIELIFCQIFLVQSDWTEVPQLCGLISQASVERRGVECLHSLHDSNTPILC